MTVWADEFADAAVRVVRRIETLDAVKRNLRAEIAALRERAARMDEPAQAAKADAYGEVLDRLP